MIMSWMDRVNWDGFSGYEGFGWEGIVGKKERKRDEQAFGGGLVAVTHADGKP